MKHLTPKFLLWVYMLLLGLIIIITVVIFMLYGLLATSTKEFTNVEAHTAAISTFGTVAQSFSDLIKVTVGAVIGALSATLNSILTKKEPANEVVDEISSSQHEESNSIKKPKSA